MDGGNVEDDPTEKKTFTEAFEELCPYYMFLGMTYDEFWYQEPERVRFYRDAHILKCKARNEEMWVQGQYFINSIQKALDPKKAEYPKKPLDLFPKTEAEKNAEARRERKKVIEYFTQIQQRWNNGTN